MSIARFDQGFIVIDRDNNMLHICRDAGSFDSIQARLGTHITTIGDVTVRIKVVQVIPTKALGKMGTGKLPLPVVDLWLEVGTLTPVIHPDDIPWVTILNSTGHSPIISDTSVDVTKQLVGPSKIVDPASVTLSILPVGKDALNVPVLSKIKIADSHSRTILESEILHLGESLNLRLLPASEELEVTLSISTSYLLKEAMQFDSFDELMGLGEQEDGELAAVLSPASVVEQVIMDSAVLPVYYKYDGARKGWGVIVPEDFEWITMNTILLRTGTRGLLESIALTGRTPILTVVQN